MLSIIVNILLLKKSVVIATVELKVRVLGVGLEDGGAVNVIETAKVNYLLNQK